MTTAPYVVFLLAGTALVLLDCHVLRRSARKYLDAVYPETQLADPIDRVLTALLHFVAFGVLALVSVLDFGGLGGLQAVVAHLGVLLLVLAAAHGATIRSLGRLRERQEERDLGDELAQRTEQRLGGDQQNDQEDGQKADQASG